MMNEYKNPIISNTLEDIQKRIKDHQNALDQLYCEEAAIIKIMEGGKANETVTE